MLQEEPGLPLVKFHVSLYECIGPNKSKVGRVWLGVGLKGSPKDNKHFLRGALTHASSSSPPKWSKRRSIGLDRRPFVGNIWVARPFLGFPCLVGKGNEKENRNAGPRKQKHSQGIVLKWWNPKLATVPAGVPFKSPKRCLDKKTHPPGKTRKGRSRGREQPPQKAQKVQNSRSDVSEKRVSWTGLVLL